MRYLVWAVRLVVFVVVLLFAINNTQLVDVHFYGNTQVAGVYLIVVMLASFVLGVVFALLAIVPAMVRRRREIRRLERDVARLKGATEAQLVTSSGSTPDVAVPLSPL